MPTGYGGKERGVENGIADQWFEAQKNFYVDIGKSSFHLCFSPFNTSPPPPLTRYFTPIQKIYLLANLC